MRRFVPALIGTVGLVMAACAGGDDGREATSTIEPPSATQPSETEPTTVSPATAASNRRRRGRRMGRGSCSGRIALV
jgi:hypothetical protein